MYKVYLLRKTKSGSEVIADSRTQTPSPKAAEAAFWDLRQRDELQGEPLLLLMTLDKQKLNAHWFDRRPGDDQYIQTGQPLRLQAAA